MSEKSNIIIIQPRQYCPANLPEHYIFSDMQCPSCFGTGNHKKYKGHHGSSKEIESVTCERCGGVGVLKAEIEIKWSPDV